MRIRVPGPVLSFRVVAILRVTVAVTAAATAGCYHGSAQNISRNELTRDRGWAVVTPDVPLVRQSSDNQCGAAALAMVLQRWSVPSSAEEIVRAIPVEKGHGISAGALRDFARGKGMQAFVIKGELADLIKEVGENRPVLVGLVQRYSDRVRAHYEVVAGINAGARKVLLLDPGRGLRQDGFDGFAAEWEAAGRVAVVILLPP